MKNPLSEHSRAIRRARRVGKSHGKQNHPHELWGSSPVPFLQALHAVFTSKIEVLDQELRVSRGQSEVLREEDIAGKQAHEYEAEQLEKERSAYEIQLEKLLEEKMGLPHENPIGKAARVRLVPIWLYVLALFALAIGEFFVTLPAVAIILNDDGLKGVVITSSFAALSIIVAHLIGLSFKTQVDRVNPQPRMQIFGSIILSIFLILVILLLSAIRSDSVASVPFSFGLPEKVFATILFFVLQLTFVLSAIALSYFNHSELDVQLAKTRRKIRRITKRIKKIKMMQHIPGRSTLTPEKRKIQIESVFANMRRLESQYREICAEYRGANLRAQAEAMAANGSGLNEDPLLLPAERFYIDLLPHGTTSQASDSPESASEKLQGQV